MHFAKNNYVCMLLSFVLLMLSFGLAVRADDRDDRYDDYLFINQIDRISRAINQFSDKKFSEYLENTNHYSFDEYQRALDNLSASYKKNYSNLEQCTLKITEEESHYTKIWIVDVINEFGNPCLHQHVDSIQQLLFNLSQLNNERACKDEKKNAIYSEMQYILTVRDFFSAFLKFYDSHSGIDKKKYHDRYQMAQKIVKVSLEFPLQSMLHNRDISCYLDPDSRVNLRKDLIDFIVNHPEFNKPFPVIRAVEDLRAAAKR